MTQKKKVCKGRKGEGSINEIKMRQRGIRVRIDCKRMVKKYTLPLQAVKERRR